jgi:hypothetical protein
MRGLLWLITEAGAKGLVLCIDEIEENFPCSLESDKDQALQALREFVV